MGAPLFPDVVVNETTIPAAAIAAEAQNHAAPSGKPGWAWQAAARALVIRELLRQEAERRGIFPEPREFGHGRHETEEEAVLRRLLEAEIDATPPDEAEIRAAYEANPNRFRAPDLYEASHILYAAPPDDADARAEARRRAEAAIALVLAEPDAFARIARAESDCSSREADGRLGQLGLDDVAPEFALALAGLGQGEVTSAPVETRFGFHVVRVDARAEGAMLPFETVRPWIAAAIERTRWAEAARGFVSRLASGARIEGVAFRAP